MFIFITPIQKLKKSLGTQRMLNTEWPWNMLQRGSYHFQSLTLQSIFENIHATGD